MAKDLPYFKFYINEWLTGKITLQDMATQGVFINVCVLFWSRDCDLNYSDCIERFKKKDKKIVENLIKLEIIKMENEKICINFLEKQLESRKTLSKKNKINGEKGLNAQKEMANANSIVGNIEERRGEESKGEKRRGEDKKTISERKLKFASTLEFFKETYPRQMLSDFYKYWSEPNKSGSKFKQELEQTWDLARRLEMWARRDTTIDPKIKKETKTGVDISDGPAYLKGEHQP